MPSLLFPDDRLAVDTRSGRASKAKPARLFLDEALTQVATIYADANGTPGAAVAGSVLTTDRYGFLPLFWGPTDGRDTLWISVNGGPVWPVYAQSNARIAAVEAGGGPGGVSQSYVDTATGNVATGAASALATHAADTTAVHGIADTALLETQAGATAKAAAAQAAAIAAIPAIGTTAGTVAAGDDPRFGSGGVSQEDVDDTVDTAVAAHNADTTAVHGIADTSALVLTGDTRLTNSRTPTAHAATHGDGGSDEIVVSQDQVTGLTGALGAKADLVGGVIPGAQIPAIALSEFLGEVGSQAAMLALVGQRGDWAIRTDNGTTWIVVAEPSNTIGNWKQIPSPGAPVTSVNSQTGTVVLGPSDVGAVPTARTVTAGTGLTGGGDLTANRTLSVAYGTSAGTAAQGNDARLSDARTPTAHAASHGSGGTDPIVVAQAQVTGLTTALSGKLDKTLQFVNVKDYGALGDNGTDDTEEIQAAITAAGPGGTVFFPAGNYRFSTITIDNGQTLRGVGWRVVRDGMTTFGDNTGYNNTSLLNGTVLRSTATAGNGILHVNTGTHVGGGIENLALIGPGSGTSTGVFMGQETPIRAVLKSQYRNVFIGNWATGLAGYHVNEASFYDLVVRGCTKAISAIGDFNNIGWYGLDMQRCGQGWVCEVQANNDYRIIGNSFIAPICQNITGEGFVIRGESNVLISPYFELVGTSTNMLTMIGAYYCAVISPTIHGSGTRNINVDNTSFYNEFRLIELHSSTCTMTNAGYSTVISGQLTDAGGTGLTDTGSHTHRADLNGATVQVPRIITGTTSGTHPALQVTGLLLARYGAAGAIDRWGNGTPEGSVTAPVGSLYRRLDGAAGTTLYTKNSGTGNTGWAPLASSSGTGDASTNTSTSAADEVALFADGGGKTLKRATGTGIAVLTSGVLSTATQPAGVLVGTTATQTLTNKTLTTPAITSPTGLVKADVGLGNVDNTSDANKPISTAALAALAARQYGQGVYVATDPTHGYTSGTDIGPAINTIIAAMPTSTPSGGCIVIPAGDWTTSVTITLKTGVRIVGAGRNATRLVYAGGGGAGHMFTWSATTNGVQVENLHLRSTSGHIFRSTSGMHTWTIRNCYLYVSDPAASVIDHQSSGDYDKVVFTECVLFRAGAATVPAVNILNSGGAANENTWRDCWFYSGGPGTTAATVPFLRMHNTTASNYCNDNTFVGITGQQNIAGLLDLQSHANLTVENVVDWDINTLTGAPTTYTGTLVRVGKTAAGPASKYVTVRNVGVRGNTHGASTYDVDLVSGEVTDSIIISPGKTASGTKLNFSQTGSHNITVLNAPAANVWTGQTSGVGHLFGTAPQFLTGMYVGSARESSGTGAPNGSVTGSVGDRYIRTDGSAGSVLYVKESGSASNTGWVAYSGGVPTSRTLTAGTGLTGGGDLSADRTFAVAYGTTGTTAAAGNDARITGATQKASNLSDLADAATARTNLGLGNSATRAVGTTAGTVAAGDDARFTATAPEINVKAAPYNAVGDGVANDTAALDAAAADAVAQNRPLFLPAGTYRRTTAWDLRAAGLTVYGAGALDTTILQATANTPILLLGRQFQDVSNLRLTYASAQAAANTAANAVELYKPYLSRFAQLHISKAARGFHLVQADYNLEPGNTTGNSIFSCTFSDMWIEEYSLLAWSMNGYNMRSTGCVFTNCYSVNELSGVAATVPGKAAEFVTWDELVFQQFNIEGVNCTSSVLLLNDVLNGAFTGLHFERVRPGTVWASGLVDLYGTGSRLTANGVTVCFSTFPSTANGGVDRLGIFKMGDGTFLNVSGFSQHSNTVTASELGLVVSDGVTAASATIVGSGHAGLTTATEIVGGTAPQFPIVKRLNENRIHWQQGGRNALMGTAAPVAGTWAVGDRIYHQAPTATSPAGWACTVAGTPGTWVPFGTPGVPVGSQVLSVKDYGAVGNGSADDRAAINTALAAATPGTTVIFPAPPVAYRITDALTVPSGVTLIGAGTGCEIRQATQLKPIFDVFNASDVTIDGFTLTNSSGSPASMGSSFRGDSGYAYSAGVWTNGNRVRVRNCRIVNFGMGLYFNGSNGTINADGTKRNGNRIAGVTIVGANHGVLFLTQDDLRITDVSTSGHVDSSSGANPVHAVYGTGTNTLRSSNVTVANCTGRDMTTPTSSSAWQFKYVDGLNLANLRSDNTHGVLCLIDCNDVVSTGLNGTNVLGTNGNGYAVWTQTTDAMPTRVSISDTSIQMTTADAAVLGLIANDARVSNMRVVVNRTTAGAATWDTILRGNRILVDGYRSRNVGTGNGNGILVGLGASIATSDVSVVDPEIDGSVAVCDVDQACTGTNVVEYSLLRQRRITNGVTTHVRATNNGTVGGTVAYRVVRQGVASPHWDVAGEYVPAREQILSNAVSVASGTLILSYFTADKTETINTITAWSGTTAAAATPTLMRLGVYRVNADGSITLEASIVSDTTLFAAASTEYTRTLSAPWSKVAGQRYATAIVGVSGVQMPSMHGLQLAPTGAMNTIVRATPAIIGRVTGQTDLPASVAAGSIVGYQAMVAMRLNP